MKISSASDSANALNQTAPSPKASQGSSAAASASTSATLSPRLAGVSVTVSTQVRGLEEAKRSDVPDVDVQKVATIKAAIANGTYTVNADAIASKLLSNAQDLLSGSSR